MGRMACFHALPFPWSPVFHIHSFWIRLLFLNHLCAICQIILISEHTYQFVNIAGPCCTTCRPQTLYFIKYTNGYSEPGTWCNLRNCMRKRFLDSPPPSPTFQFSVGSIFTILSQHVFNSLISHTAKPLMAEFLCYSSASVLGLYHWTILFLSA